MSWQKKQGHLHDHIDGRTHTHHIHLENTVTGGEHHILIPLGADACPHCKRAFPKNELGHIDAAAVVEAELEILHANHKALMAYAAHHGVPVKVGPAHSHVPEGHTARVHSDHLMLHPPKKRK